MMKIANSTKKLHQKKIKEKVGLNLVKQGIYDPNPKKDCFIGGIPISTTEQEFKEFLLEKFPEVKVKKVKLAKKKKHKKINKGFGFVCLKNKRNRDKFLTLKINFKGKEIDIRKANTYVEQQNQVEDFFSARVFLSGIPVDISDKDLRVFFEKHFEIKRCYIVKDQSTWKSKGLAFLDLYTQSDAKRCVKKGQTEGFKINGTLINVSAYNIEKKIEAKQKLEEQLRTIVIDKKNQWPKKNSNNKGLIISQPKPRIENPVQNWSPTFSFSSEVNERERIAERYEFLHPSVYKKLNENSSNYMWTKFDKIRRRVYREFR